MSPRPDHSDSCPIALAVLHPNEVLDKLEALTNFFLDHRAAHECLACSWDFLSQLIGRVFLEILLDVILLLDVCRVELVLGLDDCRVELEILCLLDLDGCLVELLVLFGVVMVDLVVLLVLDLDG
jgi:hypothetical protein